MPDPAFLSLENILFIHQREIETAGGEPSIRDEEGIKACVDAPKASFGGEFLHDLFGMAASYIACLTMRHPFCLLYTSPSPRDGLLSRMPSSA